MIVWGAPESWVKMMRNVLLRLAVLSVLQKLRNWQTGTWKRSEAGPAEENVSGVCGSDWSRNPTSVHYSPWFATPAPPITCSIIWPWSLRQLWFLSASYADGFQIMSRIEVFLTGTLYFYKVLRTFAFPPSPVGPRMQPLHRTFFCFPYGC